MVVLIVMVITRGGMVAVGVGVILDLPLVVIRIDHIGSVAVVITIATEQFIYHEDGIETDATSVHDR
jgi:hypothetical protein